MKTGYLSVQHVLSVPHLVAWKPGQDSVMSSLAAVAR